MGGFLFIFLGMINPENIYHVLPCNDLKEHNSECTFPAIGYPFCECECNPTYKEEGDGFLVIHNSFDGRENFEPDSWVRNN